jgi:catechol-2,3-dioxygenase
MAVETKAPPIQRFEHWTLVASDLERSKRFYSEVLGGELLSRDPTSVRLGGTIIDLFPARGREVQHGGAGQHHAYVIELADYDPWVEHLRRNEVPVRLTHHGLNRLSLYLEDPDGYTMELFVPFDSEEEGRREIEKRVTLKPERQRE